MLSAYILFFFKSFFPNKKKQNQSWLGINQNESAVALKLRQQ